MTRSFLRKTERLCGCFLEGLGYEILSHKDLVMRYFLGLGYEDLSYKD